MPPEMFVPVGRCRSCSRSSLADLVHQVFRGFLPFTTLSPASLPSGPGVCAFLRPDFADPAFIDRNSAGKRKGKDHMVSGPRRTTRRVRPSG